MKQFTILKLKTLLLQQLPKERIRQNIILYDFIFYSLGSYVFFHHVIGVVFAFIFIAYRLVFTSAYIIENEDYYLNPFVDLLNFLNSHLFTGATFEIALSSIAPDQFNVRLEKIHKAIQIGVSEEKLYQVLYETFPIKDMLLYCQMLRSGRYMGVKPSIITSASLNLLSQKKITVNEIYQILYQKRIEQMIMTFAPIFVILFIESMSKDFMTIMYTTFQGRMIMAFAFMLIILMKIISEKLIRINI